MKDQIKFSFSIPVNETFLRGNELQNFHHGDIFVHGVAYSPDEYDLNKVIWKGSLLQLIQLIDNPLEFINAATENHIKDLFIIHQNIES